MLASLSKVSFKVDSHNGKVSIRSGVSRGGVAGEEVAQVDKVGLSLTAEKSQPQVVGLLPWG